MAPTSRRRWNYVGVFGANIARGFTRPIRHAGHRHGFMDVIMLANILRYLDRGFQQNLLANLVFTGRTGPVVCHMAVLTPEINPRLCLVRQGAELALAGDSNLV